MPKNREASPEAGLGNRSDMRCNGICIPILGNTGLQKEDATVAQPLPASALAPTPSLFDTYEAGIRALRDEGHVTKQFERTARKVVSAVRLAAVQVTGLPEAALTPTHLVNPAVIDAISLRENTDFYSKASQFYLYLHKHPAAWPETVAPDAVLALLYRKLHPRPSKRGEPALPRELNHPYLLQWEEEKVRLGVKPSSMATRMYYVRRIVRDLCRTQAGLPNDWTRVLPGVITVDEIEDLWAYRCRLRQEGKATYSSHHVEMEYAREWFAWLRRQRLIGANPFDEFPMPKAFDLQLPLPPADQIAAFFAAIDAGPQSVLDRAVFLLMRGCGLRPGEVVSLRIGDVSLADRTVQVWGKGDKQRTIPIPSRTAQALDEYRAMQGPAPSDTPLFMLPNMRPLTYEDLRIRFRELKTEVGLAWPRGPHLWRHVFATRLAESGADPKLIQILLGHATMNMVIRYTHADPEDVRSALEGAFQRLDKEENDNDPAE